MTTQVTAYQSRMGNLFINAADAHADDVKFDLIDEAMKAGNNRERAEIIADFVTWHRGTIEHLYKRFDEATGKVKT